MDERPAALQHWHRVVQERDPGQLSDLLAQDAVFHSPVMHRPQEGRDLVAMYLTGAMQVLANDTFHYVREVVGKYDAVLEFETVVDGLTINGVDMIRWDEAGQIVDFKVMVRPRRALDLLQQRMAQLLQSLTSDG